MDSKFKQDFGIYLKSNYGLNNSKTIIITDSFFILNLVLYPNKISSITLLINNMIGSFDFNDSILKVLIWKLTNLNLINRQDLEKKIINQTDDPIIIRFQDKQVYITDMVLTCIIGQASRSETTNEQFLPLIINSIKIT